MIAKQMKRRWAKAVFMLMPLVGGTLLGTCYDTVTLVNPCGTLFTENVCSEQDWWTFTFAGRSAPNYGLDPSCTIPGQCPGLYPPSGPFGGGGGGG